MTLLQKWWPPSYGRPRAPAACRGTVDAIEVRLPAGAYGAQAGDNMRRGTRRLSLIRVHARTEMTFRADPRLTRHGELLGHRPTGDLARQFRGSGWGERLQPRGTDTGAALSNYGCLSTHDQSGMQMTARKRRNNGTARHDGGSATEGSAEWQSTKESALPRRSRSTDARSRRRSGASTTETSQGESGSSAKPSSKRRGATSPTATRRTRRPPRSSQANGKSGSPKNSPASEKKKTPTTRTRPDGPPPPPDTSGVSSPPTRTPMPTWGSAKSHPTHDIIFSHINAPGAPWGSGRIERTEDGGFIFEGQFLGSVDPDELVRNIARTGRDSSADEAGATEGGHPEG